MNDSNVTTKCLNCGAVLSGPICAQCGQKKARPISINRLFNDFWTQLLELDFRVFVTLKMLALSPGILTRNYLDGKRLPYTNPFKLLFFVATFYFLVLSYFDVSAAFSPEDKETGKAVAALLNYLIYFFLMPTALVLKWLFRQSKLNWSECYVTLCYWWSGYLLIGAILAVMLQFNDEYFIFARAGAGLAFMFFAIYQMFTPTISALIWKTLLFYIGYYLSTFLVMTVIVVLANIVKYEPLMLNLNR